MKSTNRGLLRLILLVMGALFFARTHVLCNATRAHEYAPKETTTQSRIRSITFTGNTLARRDELLKVLPFRIGGLFDVKETPEAIAQLYKLGYFSQIRIEQELHSERYVSLFIILTEKHRLDTVTFSGNRYIKASTLREKLKLDDIKTVDGEDLSMMKRTLTDAYKEEGYLFVSITPKLLIDKITKKATAHFTINEGRSSHVVTVSFKGNKKMPSRKLSSIAFTRERWILSALDGSGKYDPDILEMDARRVEYFYLGHGYLKAKVIDTDVHFSDDKRRIDITFTVEEGNQFIVRTIAAPGDDVFAEEDLLPHIGVEKGKPYSQKSIMMSIERLKELWGERGYINADVYPNVVPDETTNEVDITFYTEKGKPLYANRIDITGNEITRDRLIRRKIDLEEGDIITTKKLQKSKDAVELLSYFERGGVNWKVHRLDDERADLELSVKEAKTGHASIQMSLGSSEHSNKRALALGSTIGKRNFLGEGWDIGLDTKIQLSKNGSKFFQAHFEDPNLFDKDIIGRIAAYRRAQDFEEWRNVTASPSIRETGGVITLGFGIPDFDRHVELMFDTGWEYLDARKITARSGTTSENAGLQAIIDNAFASDGISWLSARLVRDTRNHMIYPSHGHNVYLNAKVAVPFLNDHYSFIKTEAEASYYTPLIGEDSLVLMIHGKLGAVHALGSNSDIPYKELFHMGGQGTVRGFRFGEIGPSWKNQDPLGGRYMVQFNTELIFPLIADYSMKGHLFYDAGAGWDTPPRGTSRRDLIRRNRFNLRQAVGFGLNLMYPQPIKIDWGYKLDRDRKAGESTHEFHLSANFAF